MEQRARGLAAQQPCISGFVLVAQSRMPFLRSLTGPLQPRGALFARTGSPIARSVAPQAALRFESLRGTGTRAVMGFAPVSSVEAALPRPPSRYAGSIAGSRSSFTSCEELCRKPVWTRLPSPATLGRMPRYASIIVRSRSSNTNRALRFLDMHRGGTAKASQEVTPWYQYDARWSQVLSNPTNVLELPPLPPHLVRVRFAPSPTGNLHVGGARTALFNWLYARNQGGYFIIRIEDTDQARSSRASELAVLRDLRWLGLDWDEGPAYPDEPSTEPYRGERGPYRQSERSAIYEAAAAKLIESGAVYPCFCTEEQLERKRRLAEAEHRAPQYDGTCRDADPALIRKRLQRGDPYTLRFRVPAGTRVEIRDVIRGDIAWDANATIGDFIIVRSSGLPVYNFCVAVDDALMGITTVIRAEEHLTNTLRQALILDALGYDRPQYAHVSLILGADRQKLSKRHGATSIDQYAREGFLPEAMMNYLALLGWNDGTEREIYSAEELIKAFSLDRITKSAAVFDANKLRWMNGLHLRSMPPEKLCGVLIRFWLDANVIQRPAEEIDVDVPTRAAAGVAQSASALRFWVFTSRATELLRGSIELAKDCVPLLQDILEYPLEETIESGDSDELLTPQGGFLDIATAVLERYRKGEIPFGDEIEPDPEMMVPNAPSLTSEDPFIEDWKAWVKGIGTQLGRKSKRLFHPIRLVMTGRMTGPDVGEIMRILGLAKGVVQVPYVPLSERMRILERVVKKLRTEREATTSSPSSPNAAR